MKSVIGAACAAAVLAFAGQASGAVTFGWSTTYDASKPTFELDEDSWWAGLATFANDAEVMTVGTVLSGEGVVRFSVSSDGGDRPGTMLYFTDLTVNSPSPSFVTASGLSWLLPGGAYWFGFSAAPGETLTAQLGGSEYATKWSFSDGGAWQAAQSRTITLSLAGTGGDHVGPIPEPATWALMIVGFGMAGASLRRRYCPTSAAAPSPTA